MRLKVASRKSDLARWQAVQVARALEKHATKPGVEFIFKESLGDQNLDLPLASMGSKGVFTEDFYEDLIGGRCDLVVHSWKDLPVEERAETAIVMTLPRADVRDLMLVPEPVWAEAARTGHLKVLTSSPRRLYNLSKVLPSFLPAEVSIEFQTVRGNVPTRLRKMHEQNSALILAKAGLDRLLQAEKEGFIQGDTKIAALIANCRLMVFPISVNPPAPAQGALAVEVAHGNNTVKDLCESLNDKATFLSAHSEREILHRYGGGCHQKIGVAVLEKPCGRVVSLRGLTDAGEVLNQWTLENKTAWTRARHSENVFPLKPSDNSWFERSPVQVDESVLRSCSGLMAARADAWPRGYVASPQQMVWTAGIKSWQKLASLGVWVNGCADGLGEDEDPGLHWINEAIHWTKLTHTQAAGSKDIATYELNAKSDTPDLNGKTHFFWMSGTSFERARKLFPEIIKNGYHACGPGNTHRHLQSVQGLKHEVKVFVGLEQFLVETLP